jgi:Rne/Rng family ribonuclease
MRKSIVISEQDNIAALLENDRVVEFFVNRGELLLGDIYTASVENILPGIDAAFVNLGKDKMGFLHANDVPGQGPLKERLVPKQKLLVQITKEPTGHKGPRVSTAISLPGRFLVLVPEERGVSISRRISEARERARLKAVVNLMKPPGVGLIIRTEAKGQGDQELFEDFEQLWDRWQTIVSEAEASIGPTLIYRDQDLLFRVIRDAYSHEVNEIIADSPEGQRRAQEYLSGWASKQTKVIFHSAEEPLLLAKGIDREIEAALSDRAELPSGGHLNIQPTEALTVIDVNSGRFTSSRTQAETVRRTNLEAAQEIPRQLRLRNIGGMVIVDFIDMDSRKDQQQVLEAFQRALEEDRAKPQIGQLSDLGLVELTRRRQGQSLRELFSVKCQHCVGQGVTPQLELGPPEDRRIISFKNREEERVRGRNRGKGQVLKAASASGGRIMPSIADEPEPIEVSLEAEADYEDVPEEILAQMPEDLLDSRVAGKLPSKHTNFEGEDGEAEDGEAGIDKGEDAEVTLDLKSDSFGHKPLFSEGLTEDEDFIQEMTSNLERSVSAVESVFQEMDSQLSDLEAHEPGHTHELDHTHDHGHSHDHDHQQEQATITHDHLEPVVAHGDGRSVDNGLSEGRDDDMESAQEETYEPVSSISAEVDPVTGIYRLKAKNESEEIEESAESEYEFQSGSGYAVATATEPETPDFNQGQQLLFPFVGSTLESSNSGSNSEGSETESTEYGVTYSQEQDS